MKGANQAVDRVAPRLQHNWDIRGALNFIFGGAGSGLLVASACAVPLGADLRAFDLLGLALVGAGLFSVWLKIGRPWRAHHVVRRPSTSWMSREAYLAPVVFLCGAAAIWFEAPAAYFAAGLAGLAYAYAQGRILKANIGIPAWRHWSCVALIVVTALAEGASILALAAPLLPPLLPVGYGLAALLAARLVAWRLYRADLRRTGVPKGTAAAFDGLDTRFVWIGHVGAFVLALGGALGGQPVMLALGGALGLGAGAIFKYVLVCRAAFSQGFALPHAPSRGKGAPGPGTKPQWHAASQLRAEGAAEAAKHERTPS